MTVLDAVNVLWNGNVQWFGLLNACCVLNLLTLVDVWS